ncbi:MAG TPA: hypothetical protein VFH48_42790 [Chloroflexota bacterium]|nr:hypothetical protein [Chloroflexota bacterium]
MKETGRYDEGLHMYVEEARSPDPRRLHFMRWLVEHNRFGRPALGPASGEFADAAVEAIRPSEDSQPAQP